MVHRLIESQVFENQMKHNPNDLDPRRRKNRVLVIVKFIARRNYLEHSNLLESEMIDRFYPTSTNL